MQDTSIRVSKVTRDRLRAFPGATCDDVVSEALDLLEAERFWAQAEAYHAWRIALPEDRRQELAARDQAIDAMWSEIE
jgi:hypothetical protein